MGRLEGKFAIITGAGSGLGRAMTQRFVQEGAHVLICDINEAGAQDTLDSLGELAAHAAVRRLDVTREDECAAAVEDAMARSDRLDIMVANAGIGAPGSIASLSLADWQRVVDVDLTGVFLCAKYAFRAMQATGGVILATSSVAGLQGTPSLGNYGASKAGVVQLMQTVALEGARYQIRANAICPVWTATPMVDAFVAGTGAGVEAATARLVASIPLRRLGDPMDVANAALYLASDEAAFITGIALPVDGGHMAGHGA
jgi:NAD(P)-dependent dehydrogenase (short-subunit alcohol dehydrogenase family)